MFDRLHDLDDRRFTLLLGVVAVVVFFLSGVLVWWVLTSTQAEVEQVQEIVVQEPEVQEQVIEQEPEPEPKEEVQFDKVAIQKALDSWVASISGEAGVSIMDSDGEVLAESSSDRVFFAASIYKLYVAYAGYLQIDKGQADPDELYISGSTREQCLDKMIRESDSPCAEKMWVEIGKQTIDNGLVDLGIKNTSMFNITTTAEDAAKQLTIILNSDELSEDSREKILKSMKEQIYRDAFNKSFNDDELVYNKIGFREKVEYHDVAIIELADGRKFILSAMSESVGTSSLVELGNLIQLAIK